MSIPARTKFIILTILFLLASVNFTRTAIEIIGNSKRLDDLSQEVADMEEQKKDLESSVAYKRTEAYVEEKARNDLNLIKPGEKVYVIPKELKGSTQNKEVLGENNGLYDVLNNGKEQDSNLSKWLKLFVE